ncbi:transposase [Trichonephila clavipes]|nr:transposase [Trichonephila clavipes]
MHPPYSPDLAPNYYHLFLALQNFLIDKKLGSGEDCENRLLEFFANKDQDFYERGIMKLPLKLQQIKQQKAHPPRREDPIRRNVYYQAATTLTLPGVVPEAPFETDINRLSSSSRRGESLIKMHPPKKPQRLEDTDLKIKTIDPDIQVETVQNMFHMTTTTGEKTFQTIDKSSNGRVQHVRMYGGYFSADRIFQFRQLDGPDRYTRDFKYPHNQKSAGVKSEDRGAMGTCSTC